MTLKKERDVTALMDKLLDVAKASLRAASQHLEFCVKGDRVAAQEQALKQKGLCNELENCRLIIWERLCRGAFLPLIRVDLLSIVNHIAGVVESSVKCTDTFMYCLPSLPEDLSNRLLAMADAVFSLFPPVSDCVLHYMKGADILAVVNRNLSDLNKAREQTAGILSDLKKEMFSSTLSPDEKNALYDCVQDMTAISEHACRTFEQIQLITIKL